MKIVVTGGAGHIGSRALVALLAAGYKDSVFHIPQHRAANSKPEA